MQREMTITKEETKDMLVGSSDDTSTLIEVYRQVKPLVSDAYFLTHVPHYGDCGLVAYDHIRETDYYMRFEMGDGVGTVAVPLEFATPIMVDKKTSGKVVVHVKDPKDKKRKKDDQMFLLDGVISIRAPYENETVVFKLTKRGSIPKQVRSLVYSTFECRAEGQRLCNARWPSEPEDA
jgi:hypothetical protein